MNKSRAAASEEQTRLQRIHGELAIVERDLAQAREAHSAAALSLAESPNDARLQEECSGLEDEIEQHERKKKRLEIAAAEAARLDSREAKEARFNLLKQLAAEIEKRMTRQGELAAQVIAILESIGPVVAEFDKLGLENHADLWSACKLGCNDGKTTANYAAPMQHMVAGHHALPAFVEALRSCGIVYPQMRPHVQVSSAGYAGNLHNDTVMATDNVSRKLKNLIERREAELFGKPASPASNAAREAKEARLKSRGADLAGMAELRARGEA